MKVYGLAVPFEGIMLSQGIQQCHNGISEEKWSTTCLIRSARYSRLTCRVQDTGQVPISDGHSDH